MKRLLVFVAFLSGCAYQPIVDRPGPNYSHDLAECQTYANQVLGPGGGAAGGAAIAGGLGFAMCLALRGTNCSRVAGASAIAGGASGVGVGARSEASIVRNCLLSRGHAVIN